MKLRIDSLLLLVAAAGYIATSGAHIDPVRFGLLMLAGFLGAAGARATNHYLDRDLDLVMHRTMTRPFMSGPGGFRRRDERDQPPGHPDRPPRVPLDPRALLGPRLPQPRGLSAGAPANAPRGLGRTDVGVGHRPVLDGRRRREHRFR